MTISSKSKNLPCPIRSISLPTRLHPNGLNIGAELNKLTSLEMSSSHSAETIQAGVLGLVELYNSFQELIQYPNTQKTLVQHQNGAIVEEALEGSLELLDSCAEENEERDSKNLRKLKHMENRIGSSLFLDIEQHLREVTGMTISVFKALLVFLSCQDTNIKPRGWSMISKLMITKSCQGGQIFSDMGSVDIALGNLREDIKNNNAKVDVNIARRRIQTLSDCIEGFEAGLESLYKQLIQSRVSFLNVLAL
ncbi:hypothetical protein RND71_011981 [Anisodus tanguticus]|uniref:Uncharacterized protein n=1 Tax=Anisodus tanguticus TaxID=243964 RepID=A0AAE1SCC4_9SOLA|nr:hypothetical protein RND71_011981 [Anisodus tanguticus]